MENKRYGIKVFLVSNLYPSRNFPNFGTFVKNFELGFERCGGIVVQKSVICEVTKSVLYKLFLYGTFFLKTIFKGLICKYDLIYVHYIAHTSIPILIITYLRKVKIVLNVHGDDVLARTWFVKLLHFPIQMLLKRTSAVVVPSFYFKDVFLEKYQYPREQVFVHPSGGINLNIFHPLKREKSIEDFFIIGCVSRMSKGKGWDLFLYAIKELQVEIPNLKAIVIGRGEEENNFLSLRRDLELVTVVDYYDKIKHDNLSKMYSKMDIFVFPTMLNESLGLVGLEAMACAIPVVGSNNAGLRSYIKPDYNGLLFELGNVKDLVRKVLKLYKSDLVEIGMMRKKCLETAQEYDSEKVMKSLYEKLLCVIKEEE